MASQEIITTLKSGFEAQISKYEEVKTELQAKVASVDQLSVEVEAEKKAAKEEGFNEGLAQAGQLGGEGKIYSDAELEAEIKPREEKIASLATELETLKLEKQLLEEQVAGIPTKIDEAIAALKAQLKAEYDKRQETESKGEADFGSLLV